MKSLVISGGGAKGAWTVGVLKHLILEKNTTYDAFFGVSVGALNVSCLSMFPKEQEKEGYEYLLNLWLNLNTSNIHKRWFPFGKLHSLWLKSLYNSNPLINLVHSKLDLNRVRSSGRTVSVGAVSLTSGKYKNFTQDDDCFVDGVLASSSFPSGLKPIEINGELYSDGGIQHITPLNDAIKNSSDEIDHIICAPPRTTSSYDINSSTPGLAMRAISLMSDEIISADLDKAELHNKIALLNPSHNKRHVKINTFRPTEDLPIDSLDFDPGKIKTLIEAGYNHAKKVIF